MSAHCSGPLCSINLLAREEWGAGSQREGQTEKGSGEGGPRAARRVSLLKPNMSLVGGVGVGVSRVTEKKVTCSYSDR